MSEYAPIRYRLSDEDREKFGGPEWVIFDRRKLFELPASELMALEASIGLTIGEFLTASMRGSTLGTKATIFIARKWAGIKESFSEFDPRIFLCDSEPVGEEEPDPTKPSTDGSETSPE